MIFILRCSMEMKKLYLSKIMKLTVFIFLFNILFFKFYKVKSEISPFNGHAVISCSYDTAYIIPDTAKPNPYYKAMHNFQIRIPVYILVTYLIFYLNIFTYLNSRIFLIFQFLISSFNGSKYKSISYLLI